MIQGAYISPWTISRMLGCKASTIMAMARRNGLGDVTLNQPIALSDILHIAVAQEEKLSKVVDVVNKYLPPGGIEAHDAMAEIIGLIDPYYQHLHKQGD